MLQDGNVLTLLKCRGAGEQERKKLLGRQGKIGEKMPKREVSAWGDREIKVLGDWKKRKVLERQGKLRV